MLPDRKKNDRDDESANTTPKWSANKDKTNHRKQNDGGDRDPTIGAPEDSEFHDGSPRPVYHANISAPA
jgi:hypothetical protein